MAKNSKLGQLVEKVRRQASKYNQLLQPPATETELEKTRQDAQTILKSDLPEEYVGFLSITNGLDWDGLVIYATQTVVIIGYPDRFIEGLVDANTSLTEVTKLNQLVCGESDMELFIYNQPHHNFEVRDRVSLDILETYPSFSSLLEAALKTRLD